MEIGFTKAHGLGNDFVIIDELFGAVKIPEDKKPDFARQVCERKHSVGADGVLVLSHSEDADFMMRVFNSDGSEAETCMNGLRCSAFVYLKKRGKSRPIIETRAGKVKARVRKLEQNLADVEIQVLGRRQYEDKGILRIGERELAYHFIDVGNPHAVIFLDEPVEKFPVEKIGHQVEYCPKFQPNRVNTEFVNVIERDYLQMRVHERGVCETQACASGSVASTIAACELGYCDKDKWVTVKQPGGELKIKYGKELYLRGPAEISFYGKIQW